MNIQPGGPDFPAVQMVAGGNEQFGVTGADQILIARSKGVPVVALAVIYRRNPFVLFSLPKSGIKTPADWVGKKVGVQDRRQRGADLSRRPGQAPGSTNRSSPKIPVKFDIAPLLTGAIDVWPGYLINEVLAAKEKGFDGQRHLAVRLRHRSLRRHAVHDRNDAQGKARRRAQIRRARRSRAGATPIAAPEEAAKITVKYGDKLTYDHELAMMKASVPLLQPDSKPVGSMDTAGWSSAQKLLLAAGFQKSAVDVAKAFSRRVPAMNAIVLTGRRRPRRCTTAKPILSIESLKSASAT